MVTRSVTSALILLSLASASCAGQPEEPDVSDEQILEDMLDVYDGTAPIHAQVGYLEPAGREGLSCSPPPWTDIHPEAAALDWPTFRPARLSLVAIHPLVSLDPLSVVFIVREPDLTFGSEARDATVLLATKWEGTEIVCDEGTLTTGGIVIRAGWFLGGLSDEYVYERASERAEAGGIIAVDDFDVALER